MRSHAHGNHSYKNQHEISQQKGFIQPFTASIKPVKESLHNFNTNYVLCIVFCISKSFRISIAFHRLHFCGVPPCLCEHVDIQPPIDHISTLHPS